MEFNQIKIFVAVAQKKNFSKAADALFLSQPTITNNIKKLEGELGVTLINRKSKEDFLTPEGELFYRYALELINIYAKAEYSLSGYRKGIEGTLELYASTVPEQYIIPHIIKEFKDKHPLVDFEIRHKASDEVLSEILSGHINIGFVGAKYHSDALDYIDFYSDRLVLITSPGKKFHSDPIHIADLVGENMILREEGSGTRRIFENALKKNKLNLTMFGSKIISESLEAIKKMVSLGIGVSLVPYISVKDEIVADQLNKYEIDDLDLSRNFSFVFSKNRYLSPLEEKFKNFIQNKLSIDA